MATQPATIQNSTDMMGLIGLNDAANVHRAFAFEKGVIDVEKRTIILSASSEFPVDTYAYQNGKYVRVKEVLVHDDKAVDLSRLNNGAPVLVQHNPSQQVGVVERAWLEDKKLKLQVRLSKLERGEQELKEIEDGIRRNVSIGASIMERELVSSEDAPLLMRVTRWTPYEVSFVSLPADPTVGVNRSHEPLVTLPITEVRSLPTMQQSHEQPPVTPNQPPVDPTALRGETVQLLNVANLYRGQVPDVDKLLGSAIERGHSLDAFKASILERLPKPTAIQPTPSPTDNPAQPKNVFRSLGEQLQAVAGHARGQGTDERLLEVQRAILGANTQVGADGGFLLAPQFATQIMTNLFNEGEILKRIPKISIGAGKSGLVELQAEEDSRVDGSRRGGVQVYWMGEGGEYTPSKPKLRPLETKANKLGGLFYATDEQMSDGSALASLAMESFSSEFLFTIEKAIYEGDGAGKPKGFFDDGLSLVTVSKKSGQTASTVVIENILAMYSRLWTGGKRNGVWLIHPDVMTQLPLMTVGNTPIYMPPQGVTNKPYAMLYGLPVIETEYNAPLGSKGDIVLADLTQYRLVEREGMTATSSIHVQFLTDQTAFKYTTRIGGQPIWRKPLTPHKGSSTLSPFVTLEARG